MAKDKMSEFTRWRMESKNKPKLADKALEVAAREAYETWTYLHDSQPNWGKGGFKEAQYEWKEVSRSVLRAYHQAGYLVVHQAISKAMRELADDLDEELKDGSS